MKINFNSVSEINGEKNVIDFTSFVEIDKHEDFDVFEFLEPSNKVMNRIEVKDDAVNIIAGTSFLELELGKKIENTYQTEHGAIDLIIHATKIKNNKNDISFEYEMLDHNENKVANFVITLKIFE
ncbi:glutamyl-tRNA synthetase [Mycoplasmopsis californica]|uniref:DUF1934 domain-containing protein n=1 Tax=Mycoplasmopsis equigenitalium TaxID=114883 RepID=A0ABY5J0V8_9BACT|nr:DUF1934 domain-containing protein [Mycoplasmopsis equigenitalium]UUD36897.1 DUF1934 domain-containing protein [Mycoplasmopsis equigenitalium]VEU69808.1 glutamyl-tRNA synthetase [Mycoplasmopsis californica]